VHHRPGKQPLAARRGGEEVGGARDERGGLDPGVDHGPAVLRRVLESHPSTPMARRKTWGKVDSQSMARCGSLMASISAIAASTAAATAGSVSTCVTALSPSVP